MTRGVSNKDTIAAIATPAGRGGIGVVRVSGPGTKLIAVKLLGEVPSPRYATLAAFTDEDGSVIDSGLALFFPGPHSFTGEDVLELQGHGGPVVMDMLLRRVVSCGARIARPGEFSERAFLNDKIDLSQAEAIADLIDSVSQQAAKGAMRSLTGAFSDRVHELTEMLINLRMYIEAAIDFPEEEIDFLADEKVCDSLIDVQRALQETRQQASQGALLREGISLVIAGRPNAGKSSIMNRLTGTDSSIVTTVPGTTRDIVREYVHIDGIPLRLVDTAGIRVSEDEVEIEGVRRALREAERADQILLVVDLAEHGRDWKAHVQELTRELEGRSDITVVLNKIDLTGDAFDEGDPRVVAVSALTGQGMEVLRDHIKRLAGYQGGDAGLFSARRRHLEALEAAAAHLEEGRRRLGDGAGELLAEELRLAQERLGEITGEFTSDELLGRIFESFCIGK